MGTDTEALARAYATGVEHGLQFAIERPTAFFLAMNGDPRDIIVDVIEGRLTAEQLRPSEPVAPESEGSLNL